ncbi:MAG: hypothetical protein J6S28_03650 [Clostridia bacterium]|nr:hypothetical protein [Clostridia bacterium]
MKNENIKQIICKVGKEDRYNACPQCGREVYLYMDADGDYCVGCLKCDEHKVCYDLKFGSEQKEVDMCRMSWNLWATSSVYFPEALDKMSAQHGDYVVTNTSDGFIEFAGNLDEMFGFLEARKKLNDQALYMIYTLVNGSLLSLGTSHLIELTVKHIKEK